MYLGLLGCNVWCTPCARHYIAGLYVINVQLGIRNRTLHNTTQPRGGRRNAISALFWHPITKIHQGINDIPNINTKKPILLADPIGPIGPIGVPTASIFTTWPNDKFIQSSSIWLSLCTAKAVRKPMKVSHQTKINWYDLAALGWNSTNVKEIQKELHNKEPRETRQPLGRKEVVKHVHSNTVIESSCGCLSESPLHPPAGCSAQQYVTI